MKRQNKNFNSTKSFFFLTYNEFQEQVKSILLNTNCGYNDVMDMPLTTRYSILNSLIKESEKLQKINAKHNH